MDCDVITLWICMYTVASYFLSMATKMAKLSQLSVSRSKQQLIASGS